jgi:hypothetical protein
VNFTFFILHIKIVSRLITAWRLLFKKSFAARKLYFASGAGAAAASAASEEPALLFRLLVLIV